MNELNIVLYTLLYVRHWNIAKWWICKYGI